jgi:CRISPR-associated protein Cmr2
MSNNKTFEALQEIYKDLASIETSNKYIAFCKYYYCPKNIESLEVFFEIKKIQEKKKPKLKDENKELLKNTFPFLKNKNYFDNDNEIAAFIKKYKSNDTTKDFPLAFLKEKVLKNNKEFSFDISQIQKISGIIDDKNNIKDLIEKLPKYSFSVWIRFRLAGPYFSRDDDEFYIIQNPILKETVFKVPMVRGSSWKGALAGAFKRLLNNNSEKSEIIESYLRIFGAGSESIKEIESYLKEKSNSLKDFKDNILEFMLFELGMKVKKEDIGEIRNENDESELIQKLSSKISNKLKKSQSNLPIEFQTHKGRAIFYPTYFERISLEIINPHDRRKRAGTVPIHYEVVPSETEGILQIVYIPFDGVLKKDDELKEEVKQDLEWLCEAIKNLADEGIGAKTKLGWGRFKIVENTFLFKIK